MKMSVTIKWEDASKKLPTSMEEVLIVVNKRRVCLGHYNYSKGYWYDHDGFETVKVSYWAEKPLPPEYM